MIFPRGQDASASFQFFLEHFSDNYGAAYDVYLLPYTRTDKRKGAMLFVHVRGREERCRSLRRIDFASPNPRRLGDGDEARACLLAPGSRQNGSNFKELSMLIR